MKKSYILVAVFFASFVFCTKDSPTGTSADSGFRDSIVLDLYSYNIYAFTHDKGYYGNVVITPLGQALIRPLDTVSTLKSFDTSSSMSTVIVPKYVPGRFEAWVYDTLPLVTTDSADANVLVHSYSFSMSYHFRLDPSSINPERDIRRIDVTYKYGYGFAIPEGTTTWGTGKLKIYYDK